jgi:hypothetical protein
MIIGYYYLHQNGELIYKHNLDGTITDLRDSDLVRMFWPLDTRNREHAWTILVEAGALGAKPQRIQELSETWYCDNNDAKIYADRIGVFLAIINTEPEKWCASVPIGGNGTTEGYGDSALLALIDLCKNLGFKTSKMWGASFRDLVS